jgi:hypothetical protein
MSGAADETSLNKPKNIYVHFEVASYYASLRHKSPVYHNSGSTGPICSATSKTRKLFQGRLVKARFTFHLISNCEL